MAVASKWVALTFDDGPKATVKPFLEELKRRSVRATFFVLGQLAETKTGKEALTQMARDGHEIGNHSYDHTGDPKALAKQIVRTNNIVRSITGRDTTSLRPPYGKLSETTKNSGDLVVLWSIDSLDWKTRNTDAIVSKVLKNVKSGDIVLMHDIYETTTAAASRIITDLRKKGFTFVTVSEILQEKTPGKAYASGTKEVRTLKVPWE